MAESTRLEDLRELEELLARTDELLWEGRSTPAFLLWKGQTEEVVRRAFGDKSREAGMFAQVRYTPLTHASCLSDGDKIMAFQRGMGQARFVLETLIRRLRQGPSA
jgi:hypothetical protein